MFLKKHFDREYANTLIDIFTFNVKIEYINSSQLILIENYFFIFNAFNILIKNFEKQITIYRIIRIRDIFYKFFIFFLLNLILKVNDN